jgi:hypothetical protein
MQFENGNVNLNLTPSTYKCRQPPQCECVFTLHYDPDVLVHALLAGVMRELENVTREIHGTKR